MVDAKPSAEFAHCLKVSVRIAAPPERLYQMVTNIAALSTFFPQYEFRLDEAGILKEGDIYYARRKGAKTWAAYRVLALEPNKRLSAELVSPDPLLQALRYDHRFFDEHGMTISHEEVKYTFRYGFLGRLFNLLIGRFVLRKQLLNAHRRLKAAAEAEQV